MLARRGVLELMPGASRGIRLTNGGGLPVVGRVAAGNPIHHQGESGSVSASEATLMSIPPVKKEIYECRRHDKQAC